MAIFGDMSIPEMGSWVAPLLSTDTYDNYGTFRSEVKSIFNALVDDNGMTGEEYLNNFWPSSDSPKYWPNQATIATPPYIPPREVSFWEPMYKGVMHARRLNFPDTETCPLCLGSGEERFSPGIQCSNCNGRKVQVRLGRRGIE